MIQTIYLIKRGPKPAHHNAPWHPVILCTNKVHAMWEAGETNDRSWVWANGEPNGGTAFGWLLTRWEGLDIDYGGLVKVEALPDGSPSAFWRAYPTDKDGCLVPILTGASWWSKDKMPAWLSEFEITPPADEWSRRDIASFRPDDYGFVQSGRFLDRNPVKKGGAT